MVTYQKVFTLLLQVYRARFCLRQLATLQQSITPQQKSSLILRFRLSRFADILQDYVTTTVVDVLTTRMRSDLAKADDVDAMAAAHQSYIKRLESQCLLTKNVAPIHSALMQMLDLVVAFSDAHSHLHRANDSPNHSNIAIAKEKKRRRRSALRASVIQGDTDSDHETDAENGDIEEEKSYDADTERANMLQGSFPDKVRKAWKEFDKLNHFIIAGLRQIGRSGGESCWEMLAERLE